jgi:hypothetical protein
MYKQPIDPQEFWNAFIVRATDSHDIDKIRVEGNLNPGSEVRGFHFKVTLSRSPLTWGVAHFELSVLPGCGGVLVSHNSWVGYLERGKGIGNLMQDMKLWVAKRLEVGKMIATVVHGNGAEQQLLHKHGWTHGQPFWNPHTNNRVVEWEKILK